ncbi:predicted protein [Nematostella vectensis]|uniref:Uncharacterized protein n=1 Tax=Nematostella vectensis TaxID=45351 RepID=A7SM98_NEMVE|nr:uncharacterized protein LOC5506597 [Nematostella vectensis]EDO35198.1 predicted protein [Nematostella vectensis]|eukprot:XP_001627298.1 predicted protein [Nematostella vectensis]
MVRDQRAGERDLLMNDSRRFSDDSLARDNFPRLPNYDEISATYPAHGPGQLSQGNHGSEETPGNSRFGLIRGYHRQMYDQPQHSSQHCCDCTSQPKPASSSSPNWAIICGILLLILGVLSLLMGFLLPPSPETLPQPRSEQPWLASFVDIFIISGLSVLCVGGLTVSCGLLLPLLRRTREPHEESFKFHGSEIYVKQEEPFTKSGNPIGAVNFGFHRDVIPSDISLRKVQPELGNGQPVDLMSQR